MLNCSFSLPEACLFDLDGLLLDTEPLHGEAWFQTAKAYGTNLNTNQLLDLRGRRRKDCARQIKKWLDIPVDIQELLKTHQPIGEKLLRESRPMPGAQELVDWCNENNLPMALVTSSTLDSLNFKCAPHSWLKLINTRVLGDDPLLSKGKPAPDPYLLAAKRLNTHPKVCWALEDSPAGIKSAMSAGCLVWILGDKKDDLNEIKSFNKNPIHINHLTVVKSILNQLKIKSSNSQ